MTCFVALLRAVNVGGTGALPMKELAALCAGLGHDDVRTYIASGNVLFRCALSEADVRSGLERALAARMGKAVDVMVRTGAEMRAVLEANPFPAGDPKRVVVAFLNAPAPEDFLGRIKNVKAEEVRILGREIYLHYRDGIGRSKLKLPSSPAATGRNLNTVARLAELAR
jgi:uncharacterized protein (DUF1697 family)